MKAELEREATKLHEMLSNRHKVSREYINSGIEGVLFWDLKAKTKTLDNHAYIGSAERFNERLAELKGFDYELRLQNLQMFCLEESETWFKGFPDDSIKNRMDFCASLFKELKELIK